MSRIVRIVIAPFDVYCPQCKWNNDRTNCISEFWHSEYIGTPTIPLSVIEKIHDAIDNASSDDFYEDEHGYIIDSTLTTEHIHEIIDEAVKEYTHERT